MEEASYRESAAYTKMLDEQYRKAVSEIEKEINSWYQRFAKNNKVTLVEAKQMLKAGELKELKWSVEEYIKYGKENAINARWMKQLENASARFHISRLEALKLSTQQSIEKLYGNQLDGVDQLMRNTFKDHYYKTAFEVQKGFGVGWNFSEINESNLDKIMSKPWTVDGKNFSERIWGNKEKLINELHTELTQMCVLGNAPDKTIKNIAKKMNVSCGRAKTLVMTESAYFQSTADYESMKKLGVEEYEIVATLDSLTSEICQDMDGQVFKLSEYEVGSTAPPFHPNCRTVTVPYFDDEFTIDEERAARGEDGKTYYVPADMKYHEWKEAYITDSISEQTKKEFSKYSNILGIKSPSIEEFAKIKYNDIEWKMFKAYVSSIKTGELSALADFELYKNISKEMDEKLLGAVTSNNITITGKSNHSIARVIGSIEQKRNGVQVSDILDALTNKDSEILPVKEMKNGKSQKFRNKVVEVSVNPDTGNIIQVNPVHTRKKKVKS